MYSIKKLCALALFSLLLMACSATRYGPGGAEPLLQQPLSADSKILIASSFNDNIYFDQGLLYSGHYLIEGLSLDPVISESVAQVVQNKSYQTVIKPWSFNKSSIQSFGSTMSNMFTGGITPGTVSLKPEVISQLQSLNSGYHADYFLLTTSGVSLTCPHGSKRSVYPARLSLTMYLIDAKTNQVLTWHYDYDKQSGPSYSDKNNKALCKEIRANQQDAPRVSDFRKWMEAEAAQLAQQVAEVLFTVVEN